MATTPEKPAPAQPAKATRKKKPKRAKAKRPPNRPPHVPTDATREVVRALAATGATQAEIAAYLRGMMGIKDCGSKETLAKHYPIELSLSKMHQNLMVRQGLYRQAVGAPADYDKDHNKLREELKPNVTAQIFWLKAQAGWKDNQTVTIDPDQKPIPVSVDSLSDRQLDELEARLLGKLKKPKA